MIACIDFRATYATTPAADKPLEYNLTQAEKADAALMQAQILFDADQRNRRDARERGE